ncbi:MAG: hypothetical protein EP330_00190 [Deltaproteobacteria bacterium]|nr:MAG: hypothetical protein EP330_00190 [Deltaproteobacteria bacterium]
MTRAWAPLRISFAGGGSDLPAFCDHEPGAVVSATLAWGVTATVGGPRRVDNPLMEAVRAREGLPPEIALATHSDAPIGSGLGGSSAATVAALLACRAHHGASGQSPVALARDASAVELVDLALPVGRQDAYAAAFGGVNHMVFGAEGRVEVSPLALSDAQLAHLSAHLWLVDTRTTRQAASILKHQGEALARADIRARTRALVALVPPTHAALAQGDVEALAAHLSEGWALKRTLAPGIETPPIRALYEQALVLGALGGKLLGAGGGGFLLMVVPPSRREALGAALPGHPVRLTPSGARIL